MEVGLNGQQFRRRPQVISALGRPFGRGGKKEYLNRPDRPRKTENRKNGIGRTASNEELIDLVATDRDFCFVSERKQEQLVDLRLHLE